MSSSFISCDWGTSSFRLRLVSHGDLSIQRQVKRNQGIKDVFSQCRDRSLDDRCDAFEEILREATDELFRNTEPPSRTIFLSGMASSSIGWKELPYTSLPFPLTGESLVYDAITIRTANQQSFKVLLFSGIASETEIMRGEECELIGIASLPALAEAMEDCLVVLPGTHSKHVSIRDRRITDFHTVMTGELFDTISKHTILSASLTFSSGMIESPETPANQAAFASGVELARDLGFARSLFQIRTRSVLHQKSSESNRWFLSGLLIGSEWLSLLEQDTRCPIVLAAGSQFSAAYQSAAQIVGLDDRIISLTSTEVTQAAIRGHAKLQETFANQ